MSGKKVILAIIGGLAATSILWGSAKASTVQTPPKPPTGGSGGGGGGHPKPPSPPNSSSRPYMPTSSGAGDGLEWFRGMPPGQPTPQRDQYILKAIEAGMGNLSWGPLTITNPALPGYELLVVCSKRTLRIGKTNPVRVSMRYDTQQQIGMRYGATMCTPLVLNEIDKIAVRLPATPMGAWVTDNTMGRTDRMLEYSQKMDSVMQKAGVPQGTDKFLSNEGKDWVIASRLWSDPIKGKGWNDNNGKNRTPPGPWAANYGWFKPGGGVIQTVGLDHNFGHVDYSQQARYMMTTCILNGIPVHVGQVLADPKFHRLLSNEGVLPGWVHPAFGGGKLAPLPPIPAMGSV